MIALLSNKLSSSENFIKKVNRQTAGLIQRWCYLFLKWNPSQILELLKNITNSQIGQKNLILRNIWKQMYSFNLYDWFANFRDFSKAWQMKLKLWHLILQKIVKVSSGQKNQTCCQIYMKKFFLSLPITFSVLVNVFPYQIFIQNTQITVFNFFPTKFGALPILQECPCCWCY